MLKYTDENGVVHDKVETSIRRLRSFEPEDGYYLAFSGGKDFQCVYHLAEMAGVKFDAHYNVTSVDPPELVQFIKKQYPQVHIDVPVDKNGKLVSMWSLIASHTMPPTRVARYCCAELKEASGKNRVTVTGVRWAESARRKNLHGVADINTKAKRLILKALTENGKAAINDRGALIMNDDNAESRRMVEQCYRTKKTVVNPIVDGEVATGLQSQITENKTGLANEVSRATAAENALGERVTTLEDIDHDAYKAADTALKIELTDEIGKKANQSAVDAMDAAYKEADTALSARVKTVEDAIGEGGSVAVAIADAKKAGTDAKTYAENVNTAVEDLGTRVSANETSISGHADRLTELESKVGEGFVAVTNEQIDALFAEE